MRTSAWAVTLVPVVMVAAGVTGCSSAKKSSSAAVTVTATATPSTSASTSATKSGVAPAKKTTAPRPKTPVPTLSRCDAVLPLSEVDKAVGHAVAGATAFVVNQPDPTIHQLARINCQYGLASAAPAASSTAKPTKPTPPASRAAAASAVPQVEVSVSLYTTTAAAAARITATDSDWTSRGAKAHQVSVAAHPATVLVGYGRPLLVLAAGIRTVAVNVRPGTVPSGKLDAVMAQIARSALAGSGG